MSKNCLKLPFSRASSTITSNSENQLKTTRHVPRLCTRGLTKFLRTANVWKKLRHLGWIPAESIALHGPIPNELYNHISAINIFLHEDAIYHIAGHIFQMHTASSNRSLLFSPCYSGYWLTPTSDYKSSMMMESWKNI